MNSLLRGNNFPIDKRNSSEADLTEKELSAFDLVKKNLSNDDKSTFPNYETELSLVVDASSFSSGAVL